MYLENVVIDAADPQALGSFWSRLLSTTNLTDSPDSFETRLRIAEGAWLDLCFQRVCGQPLAGPRLHLDIRGGAQQTEVVEQALTGGALQHDIGQHDVPWIVLADPEGNPFCVMEDRPAYAVSGPIAAIPVDSSDPDRDLAFWVKLSGWIPQVGDVAAMRHPSGHGPLLEFFPEREPKLHDKNRLHLDLRTEIDDQPDDITRWMLGAGAHQLHPDWGELPWQLWADPSGNEFCVLPARGPAGEAE